MAKRGSYQRGQVDFLLALGPPPLWNQNGTRTVAMTAWFDWW